MSTEMQKFDNDDGRGEYVEIEVKVGPAGNRRQRFVGRLLGETREVTKTGVVVVRVYQTKKGKFVVHRQESDWSDFSNFGNWTKDIKRWRDLIGLGNDGWGDCTVDIVDSLAELRDRLPDKLFRIVEDKLEHPTSQVLDI